MKLKMPQRLYARDVEILPSRKPGRKTLVAKLKNGDCYQCYDERTYRRLKALSKQEAYGHAFGHSMLDQLRQETPKGQKAYAHFSVEWTKGGTYGMQARVKFRGEVAETSSGCGIDKLSCALTVLRFLFPVGSEAYCKLSSVGGGGEGHVQTVLLTQGYRLEKISRGDYFDGYRVSKHGRKRPDRTDAWRKYEK